MPTAGVDSTQLRDRVTRWGSALLDEAVDSMVRELREAAPLGETGETRRGITAEVGGDPLHPKATIRSTGKGGTYVEEGTQPHEITPVRAQALRFLAGGGRISQPSPNQRIATRGGGVVFATVVHHPGMPPRPWFAPVLDRFLEFVQRARARVQG